MPEIFMGPNNTIPNFSWNNYIQNMTSDASNNLYLLYNKKDSGSNYYHYGIKEIIKISKK